MVASDHVCLHPRDATVGVCGGEKRFGEGHGHEAVAVFFQSLQDGGRVCNPRVGSPTSLPPNLRQDLPKVILHHPGAFDAQVRTLSAQRLLDPILPQGIGLLQRLLQCFNGIGVDLKLHRGGVVDDPLKIPQIGTSVKYPLIQKPE